MVACGKTSLSKWQRWLAALHDYTLGSSKGGLA